MSEEDIQKLILLAPTDTNWILQTRPELKGPCALKNLAKMDQAYERSLALFKKFEWSDQPVNDGRSICAKWVVEMTQFEGMRHRESRKPHGVCRQIFNHGEVIEAQWKDGIQHGLSIRWYGGGYTELRLFKNGKSQDYYYNDPNWAEYGGGGDYFPLKDLMLQLRK